MRARLVFEKFSEKSDPIADMGIGYKNQILNVFSKLGKDDFFYGGTFFLLDDNKGSFVISHRAMFNDNYETINNSLIRSGFPPFAELRKTFDVIYEKGDPSSAYGIKFDLDDINENMQAPFRNDGNRPISQRYPLDNLNYLGDCANDNKKKKKRKKIKK